MHGHVSMMIFYNYTTQNGIETSKIRLDLLLDVIMFGSVNLKQFVV